MKDIKIPGLLLLSALISAPAFSQQFSLPSISVKDVIDQANSAEVALPVPAPVAQPPATPQKEWTIMVYMNGKNSLSNYVESDMNEMEQVGSTSKINIVTQAGRTLYNPPAPNPTPFDDGYDVNPWGGGIHPGYPGIHPQPYMSRSASSRAAGASWTGIRRYFIKKDTDTATVNSTLLAELPKTDMGDWNNLVDFVAWARAAYPAKKYMLIVWNHGDGWMTKSAGARPFVSKGISYDDETGNGITTVQLGAALAKMGGVDVYGSDACLMQMAEVVYEIKDSAPVIIGSEETEPGDGWDYAAFLTRMVKTDLTPEAVARAAVDGFHASYAARNAGVTMSAVRSASAEPLRLLLDQWADLAMAQDKAKLKEALNESKGFEGVDSRDLLDFMAIAGAKLPALKTKGAEITELVAKRMLIDNAPAGDSYKKAFGLGIYLPSYSFDGNYSKLAMSAAGKWDDFAKWITAD